MCFLNFFEECESDYDDETIWDFFGGIKNLAVSCSSIAHHNMFLPL